MHNHVYKIYRCTLNDLGPMFLPGYLRRISIFWVLLCLWGEKRSLIKRPIAKVTLHRICGLFHWAHYDSRNTDTPRSRERGTAVTLLSNYVVCCKAVPYSTCTTCLALDGTMCCLVPVQLVERLTVRELSTTL